MGCLLPSILLFLVSVLPCSFACTLGESFPRLSRAPSQGILIIYAPAHADDRNRCSINYAWNYIPPVLLLLITVSLLPYLFRKKYLSVSAVSAVSAYRKTLNLGSAAMWNTPINGSVSSLRMKLFSLLAVLLSAGSTLVCCSHVRYILR